MAPQIMAVVVLGNLFVALVAGTSGVLREQGEYPRMVRLMDHMTAGALAVLVIGFVLVLTGNAGI